MTANGCKDRKTVQENTIILMRHITKVAGIKIRNKVMVFSKVHRANMLVNGKMIKNMEKVE
jgi:hypothetical protein